ncbi:MAG: hypothetical protein WCR20_13080 [Verrucomicrobiota bacterium]|nr:hypothetical protein [Verrucomicrobiota bacterium]
MLQTVAWAGMFVRYSHNGTFQEAVGKTFDGQHPCNLCKAISSTRAEQQKQDQAQSNPISKLDAGLPWSSITFSFLPNDHRFTTSDDRGPTRSDQPPKPRPRCGTDSTFAGA